MSEETKSNNVTDEEVREALRGVLDPELHLDVVALGLIREIDLDSTPAVVRMLLTTPFCPYGPWLVQQVKETSEKAAGRDTKVEVLPEQWNPEMMEDPTLLGFF
ncbi:MAG: metal-sulfur cluster assembly factor [Anaerolineales bacterium]|nr:metal-sulfur cluster assembly factor [Anaerolineales bacterium]